MGTVLLMPNHLDAMGRSIFFTAIFVSNHLFRSEAGYFDAPAEEKPSDEEEAPADEAKAADEETSSDEQKPAEENMSGAEEAPADEAKADDNKAAADSETPAEPEPDTEPSSEATDSGDQSTCGAVIGLGDRPVSTVETIEGETAPVGALRIGQLAVQDFDPEHDRAVFSNPSDVSESDVFRESRDRQPIG